MKTDGYDSWTIPVPGRYLSEVAYLDIETVKVPTSPGFRMRTGEPLGRRWSAYLAGVARPSRVALAWGKKAGEIVLVEKTGSEPMFLAGIRRAIGDADTVVYLATRKFDEMILKGRYTYARRGPEDVAFYPAMPGAEDLTWDCLRPGVRLERSATDLASRETATGRSGDETLIHNLRDVVELILMAGEPDAECEAWGRRVMADDDFARDQIFGGEDDV